MGFSGGLSGSPGSFEVYLGSELQFGKEGDWGKKKVRKFCTPSDPLLGNETDIYLGGNETYFGNETEIDLGTSDTNGNELNSTP